MAAYRISWTIVKGKNGCTENWYAAGSLASVLLLGKQAIAARNLLLTKACYITDLFVRGVDPDSLGQTDYDPMTTGGYGALSADSDVNNVGALVRVATEKGFKAKPYIHGMPDDWCIGSSTGLQRLTGDAIDALKVYFAKLQGLGLGLRGISRLGADAGPQPVQKFVWDPVAGLWTMFAGGFAFVAGETAIVTRGKGYLNRQFRGKWKVIAGGAGSSTVSKLGGFDQAAVLKPNTATVRHVKMVVDPVNSFQAIRPGTKKMGRIPNVVPGRRSATR